jgi:CRISPR-associated protein Csb2
VLAVCVDLLTGRYAATAYNDRDRAEWPPHPARLFSALVATWGEGEPSSSEGELELQALRWLERQAAPDIVASPTTAVAVRDPVPIFVPVNDVAVLSAPDREKLAGAEAGLREVTDPKARATAEKEIGRLGKKLLVDTAKAISVPEKTFSGADVTAAAQLFPERRPRQPRTFPSVSPEVPKVIFAFADAAPTEDHRCALRRLLSRMVRLGHSSSLVHARLVDDAGVVALETRTTRFLCDPEQGSLMLRWVGAGQFDRLHAAFERHQETEPRVMPATFVRYREGRRPTIPQPERSHFDDEWVILARVAGPRLPSTSATGISRQLRRALMSFAEQPVPEVLSGHGPGGDASQATHLAVVPLPFVGSEHADGALLGVALVLPRAIDPAQRRAVMSAMARFEATYAGPDDGDDAPVIPLNLGTAGVLHLQRVAWGEHKSANLRPATWSRASRAWTTATPVALDRNPGNLQDDDHPRRQAAFKAACADVIEAVRRIGLPSPVAIDVVRSCLLPGSAKPRTFPRFPSDGSRPQRVLVHVSLRFAAPVRGPILVGAGRYQGLGLFRPLDDDREVSR